MPKPSNLGEGQLIHWETENAPNFGYSTERAIQMMSKLRQLNLENAATMAEDGPKVPQWAIRSLEIRTRALAVWESNPAGLADRAREMVEVAREIDQIQISLRDKVAQFLARIGGKEHFYEIHDALCGAGALHDVAQAIAAAEILETMGRF